MLKTRILLVVISAAIICLIFLLPKVVVNSENELSKSTNDSIGQNMDIHVQAPEDLRRLIKTIRGQFLSNVGNEKNAIFADSLATLYLSAGQFDSAAWFAGESSTFFNTIESWTKAGDSYYQAFTFALDQSKQDRLATKAQEFYSKVLEAQPQNLDVKTKMAMTYVSSASPMKGIMMLREVLAQDPKNELALFNMGMLSIQSGQYDKAAERLRELVSINPGNTQAQLLLGIALMNIGDKKGAKEQFEKVKQGDTDPAVQATADSYLKDLK